jgi:hypothetical protein
MSYIGNQPQSTSFLSETFSGNGSTTVFALRVAPANTAAVIIGISGILQSPNDYAVVGNILTFSSPPPIGTGNISVRYLSLPASNVATSAYRSVTDITATAGQTTFSTGSYTPGFVEVFRNGVRLGVTNYTATSGVAVVLGNPANAGDLITVVSFFISSVINAIPGTAGAVTANLLDAGQQGGSGAMIVPTGSTGQRPIGPVAGMTRFNTTLSRLEFYNGTAWFAAAAGPDNTRIRFPTSASDPGSPVEGDTYYSTTEYTLKTFSGGAWRPSGQVAPFTATFDYFQDGSAVSLHRLDNSLADTGGVHTANTVGSATFTTPSKFGSRAINLFGNGTYLDIPTLQRIYAVSFWAYAAGSAADNGYLVDFRHDAPGNGRGYLYTAGGTKNINLSNDSTTSNGIGNIYINSVLLTSNYTFPLNTWVHVVVSSTNGAATAQTWDQGLRFGNRSDGTTEGNFGWFDQIRTFNRPLSQAEVTRLFNEVEAP